MSQHATVTAIRPRHTPIPKRKCIGQDPDAWFPPEPPDDRPEARATYETRARDLCAGCPLAVQCLTDELERMAAGDRATWGVLGGTAPWERKTLVRNSLRASYDLHEAAIRFHERAEEVAS